MPLADEDVFNAQPLLARTVYVCVPAGAVVSEQVNVVSARAPAQVPPAAPPSRNTVQVREPPLLSFQAVGTAQLTVIPAVQALASDTVGAATPAGTLPCKSVAEPPGVVVVELPQPLLARTV